MTKKLTRNLSNKLKPIKLLFVSITIAFFSPVVLAASETTPWKTYLFVVMTISVIAAWILSVRNKKAESFMGKFLLGGLYFWIFTFAQLIVLSLIYYLNK